jgi:hypothetical protein
MPYRRLPNTDAARLRALNAALIKGKELPPFNLSYSQSTFQKVQSFLPGFEKIVTESKTAWNNQIKKGKEYQIHLKKAKMYISHFIQVLNLAIIRGDIPTSVRSLYGFEEDVQKLPQLNNESEVIAWGEKIINAETERTRKGGNPITNPTIAVVKVRYENFIDAFQYQSNLKKTVQRASNELVAQRKLADEIILKVWNEVEDSLKDLPENIKREQASQYGVVYVYRHNELGNSNLLKRSLVISV